MNMSATFNVGDLSPFVANDFNALRANTYQEGNIVAC